MKVRMFSLYIDDVFRVFTFEITLKRAKCLNEMIVYVYTLVASATHDNVRLNKKKERFSAGPEHLCETMLMHYRIYPYLCEHRGPIKNARFITTKWN